MYNMRKRWLAWILAGVMLLSLAGCGGKTAANDGAGESSGGVEVEKKLLTVDVTIPALFFEDEDMSEFDPVAYAEENGYQKAALNEDGSVTVTMTKAKHTELMEEIKTSAESSFSELANNEDYPYIQSIRHSDSFDSVDILVDQSVYDQAGLEILFLPLGLYMLAGMYRAFDGQDSTCQISFVDAETEEVLSSATYPDDLEGFGESSGEGSSAETMVGSGDLGDYHVEIKDASLETDYEGNTAIVITYAWTNNSEETTSAMMTMLEKAFQDGVQLDTALIFDSSIYDSGASTKEVRPGTTIDVQCAFVLTSDTSTVEFELSEAFSWTNNGLVTMDFNPSELGFG